MLLYLILDPTVCDPVAVAAAAAGYVDFVQLRDYPATDAEYSATARNVMAALEGSKAKFLVAERPHLVPRLGADGVHIGEKYRDIYTAREEIGAGPILGVSQFTPEFIAENLGEDFPVDYLSIGPVWHTVSKADAGAEIGVETAVTRALANPYQSAMIGGINADNAGLLAQRLRGAHQGEGLAAEPMIVVLGAICRAADPRAAASALREALN